MKHKRRARRQQEAALQLVLDAFQRLQRTKGGRPTAWQHGGSTQPLATPEAPMNSFPMNADTLNSLHNTMAGLVIALQATFTAEQREQFSERLARLAKNAEARGDTTLETMLLDMYRASTL